MTRARGLPLGLLCLALVMPVPAPARAAAPDQPAHTDAPVGWASAGAGTTGGAGATAGSIHVVEELAQLRAALANNGIPDRPKVVYVRGTIHGNQAPDGRLLTDHDYAPGWDIGKYMACFVDGRRWRDEAHPWCAEVRWLRTTGSNAGLNGRPVGVTATARRKFEADKARALAEAAATGTGPPKWGQPGGCPYGVCQAARRGSSAGFGW